MLKSLRPSAYYPSAPRTGGNGELLFRMQNAIIRGVGESSYVESYAGSLDLGENIATLNLTGTISCTLNSTTVSGSGTAFTTELCVGQFLLAHGGTPDITIPLVVDEILSDTSMIVTRAPQASSSGCTATKLPVLFEINKKRGTLIRGNAVMFDLGTILCVGDGTLRLNGAVLSGTSLAATRQPKIAVRDNVTGNYSVYTLGMNTPTSLSAAALAGGTKNMQAGVYSLRVVPARQATNGYNNPSPKAEVTITTGQQIRLTVPAADTTNGQTAWKIFGSLFTQAGGVNGPWYLIRTVNVGSGAGEIPAAGGTYDIEWNDAEISGSDILTFDNDAPPKAKFVSAVGGIPIWISCQGLGATSPGPFVVPVKQFNVEAAPLRLAVSTSLPDTILGQVVAQGRLYLMCVNTLQIGQATQTTDSRVPPIAVRPFWKAGFKNPYSLLFVDGVLVGATSHGLARSVSEGDEGAAEFNFAIPVNELVLEQNPGHQLLALDPQNEAIALFYSGNNLNASGYWTTRVLLFGLRENRWIGDVLLTSTTGDMLVSGVATVNGELEFLAGGRQSGGGITVRTYRWDTKASVSVPWFIAWGYTDGDSENRPKRVSAARAVGKFSGSPTLGVHIVEPSQEVGVAVLEAGNSGSATGAIPLATGSGVTQLERIRLNVRNCAQFAVRVDGTYSGSGVKDRVDECVLEWEVEGARR